MELTTIVAVSDDRYMQWQIQLLLESFKEHNFNGDIRILLFKPLDRREWNKDWGKIEDRYPNIKFFRYEDDGSVHPLLRSYHTIHRAYSLKKHWEQFPELKDNAILYLDSDVLLTKELNLEPYLQDNINYGADIRSYNNQAYFDGKEGRVRPEKMEEYLREDPLEQMWKEHGVSRELLKEYNDDCAGVHYLLKNITVDIWDEVLTKSVPLIQRLEKLNQYFIEGDTPLDRKNNGWQSFCADIYILLWALYKRGGKTKILDCLNFTWSTDTYSKVNDTHWMHNCSISSEDQFEGGLGKAFYKGKRAYVNNLVTPFDESEQSYIDSILNNEISKKYANYYYAEKIKQLYNQLNN